MSYKRISTYVLIVALLLAALLVACSPGLKVKTNTELEVPSQIQASENTFLARR